MDIDHDQPEEDSLKKDQVTINEGYTRKSVFAIHVIPQSGSLSLHARKMQVQMAKMAGEQYRKLPYETREQIENAIRYYVDDFRSGKQSDEPPILLQPRFKINIKHLAEQIGFNPDEARKLFHHLDILQTTQVKFNALSHGAAPQDADMYPNDVNVVTSLVSSYIRSSRGMISWAYDPVILSIMVNPRTYAQLNLQLVRHAGTYTALALYENVKRFVDMGKTGVYEVKRWQEMLSENGKVPEWETAAEFRKKIKRTLRELVACEACDITIEPVEEKDPVTSKRMLYFKVRRIVQPQLSGFGAPIPPNKQLYNALKEIGIAEPTLSGLIETNSEEMLFGKLQLLKNDLRAGKSIGNQAGWFIEAIKRNFISQDQAIIEARKSTEEMDKHKKKMDALKREFDDMRTKTIRERYMSLDVDEQEALMHQMQFDTMSPAEVKATPAGILQNKLHAWLKVNKTEWITSYIEREFTDFLAYKLEQDGKK